jgi:hypothetical protein
MEQSQVTGPAASDRSKTGGTRNRKKLGVLEPFRGPRRSIRYPTHDRVVSGSLCVLIVCVCAGWTAAQCPALVPKGPEPFKQLRYEEDYRYLRDESLRTDHLDRIKYIPLNKDESVYLSLGGEIRQRYEIFRNPEWAGSRLNQRRPRASGRSASCVPHRPSKRE